MLQHGLEVAVTALQLRRAYLLPRGAAPETIAKKHDLWTYAVFTAALCHDLAKPAVDQAVTLFDTSGKAWPWVPWTGPMAPPEKWYRSKFRQDRLHRVHERASLILLGHILPSEGFDWLSSDPELFAAWLACIGGDILDSGPIGEIVGRADRESVGRNLGANPEARTVESGIKALHEKLLSGLRHLLTQDELPLNRNGAAGWLIGDDLWLVSKRAVDTLRVHLLTEGHSGIPNRNERIFDALQERGILIPCVDRAIWRARVKGEDWEHELTLIRIPAGKIWPHSEVRPEVFSGEVIPNSEEQETQGSGSDDPDANGNEHGAEGESFEFSRPDTGPPTLLPETIDAGNIRCLATGNVTADDVPLDKKETPPEEHDDPGKRFLDWLRENIQNGDLPVGSQDARVHMVAEGAFLVSPAIFKDFVEKSGSELSWEQVQKRFLKLSMHAKTSNGLNVHKYKLNGASLNGIIVPELKLY